jgi:Protein of unknown function (DUF3467)
VAEGPIPRFYANAMAIHGGPYDVALDFGQRVGAEDPDWQFRILTNWEHAKAMAEALSRVIEQYEADLGVVRDVEEATAAIIAARSEEQK